jgi:Domain of unknown function (DUF4424)
VKAACAVYRCMYSRAMFCKHLLATGLAFLAVMSSLPIWANDSSSAIGLGGLELTRNDAISMDREDLYLSREKVIVKYRFTNTTAKDVETLVSFPLPPIPGGIRGHLGDQSYPDWPNFDFQTKVNGKPVKLDITTRIEANGKDVSARLKQLGWPEDYWGDRDSTGPAEWDFIQRLEKLPAETVKAYVAEGLLRWQKAGANNQYARPNWNEVTYFNRTQLFPAGKSIEVEHSYKPIAGGSVGGMLERQYRKEGSFRDYVRGYCLDKSFLKGFDRRRYAKGGDGSFYVEHWLDYVLKSGANWKGPIKDFRLVIDKGKPENLISFCTDGVKKISPTQFEIRKVNFEPAKDLSILIVEFIKLEN